MGLYFPISLSAFQEETAALYEIRSIAFYNLENLFDTANDSLTFDDARTPEGKHRWTASKYKHKIASLSKVLNLIGRDKRGSSPDIIGLCELENLKVIKDVFNHENLQEQDYEIIHYDSPDERGIDVALAYRRASFVPFSHRSIRLLLEDSEGYRDYTRDLLAVGGMFGNEELYILVNHWPSRSGGESSSRGLRMKAAQLNMHVIDSIRRHNPESQVLIMGDFNDNPTDHSIKNVMKVIGKRDSLKEGDFYNPMEPLYNKGIGSLGYKDQWHLFDQILISNNLVRRETGQYFYWKAGIFNPSFLVTQEGPYSGYPKRTYASGSYQGGYSDHFPVYLYLLRKVK